MKFGIGSYAYAWSIGVPGKLPESPMTIYEFIDRAEDLQVSCVEIDDNIPLISYSSEELVDIKKYAISKGVEIVVGMQRMTADNVMDHISIAEILGSPFLRVMVDEKDYYPSSEECVSIIKEVVPELEKRNIALAIENHDRFSVEIFRDIIIKSGSDYVKICLDTVNSYGATESIEKAAKILGPYAINLHLKEFCVQKMWHNMGFIIEGAPLGKGRLPVKWILDKVSKNCKTTILELWTPPEKDIESTVKKEQKWVVESVNYFKKKFYRGDFWI